MNIFEYTSYYEALADKVSELKAHSPKMTLAKLAQSALMQPSYLTNVLKGRCHFNSDQLFRLCEQLNFNIEEVDYLQLLLEYEKTAYARRKSILEKKIKEIRQHHLRAEKNLSVKPVELNPEELAQYYLDPYIQLVHIFLHSKKGRCTTETITRQFSLSPSQATKIISTLEKLKYIKKNGMQFDVLVEGRHLPRDSQMAKPHLVLMRLKSLDQIQRLSTEQTYSFSATISTLPEVRTRIQAEFVKFLKASERLVNNHDPKHLYQINFDLFPWDLQTEV